MGEACLMAAGYRLDGDAEAFCEAVPAVLAWGEGHVLFAQEVGRWDAQVL